MNTPTNQETFHLLSRALARLTRLDMDPAVPEDLLAEFGAHRPFLFLLVDGLGECCLKRLPGTSFLRSSRETTLWSVFPSTTACALTTLASGLPPAMHGIPGRYSCLPEKELQVNTLAFRERFSGSLLSPDTDLSVLWPHPSLIPATQIPVITIIPEVLNSTPFEEYLCGGRGNIGYRDIEHAVDLTCEVVISGKGRAYYFLYIWELDSLGHEVGTEDEKIDSLLLRLDRQLLRLKDITKNHADMIITADHGHIDSGERTFITPEHPLMSYLSTPPYGEPRAVQFKIRPERKKEFASYFDEAFSSSFDLYPMSESAMLFGAPSLSGFAEKLFGDYLAVARDRNLMIYTPGNPEEAKVNLGEHGGSLPDERLIPLIIPR